MGLGLHGCDCFFYRRNAGYLDQPRRLPSVPAARYFSFLNIYKIQEVPVTLTSVVRPGEHFLMNKEIQQISANVRALRPSSLSLNR